MALDKVTTGVIADDAITSEQLGVGAIAGSDIAANVIEVKPHIKPGILQPAVAGKLLDGTTNHSGAYGTAQSDGRSYYYTDIKGSKPIKDPRIGAHFGSQRHMFKSIQKLEQESAINGIPVSSIDGREWMRIVDPRVSTGDAVGYGNIIYGTSNVIVRLKDATSSYFEITGYFNAFNFINQSSDTSRTLKIEVDGVTAHAGFNPNGVVNSPLTTRYVSAGSVFNVDLTASSSLSSDTTLGIHTIKISYASGYGNYPTGCELIVQDTSSTANKSKIQIPSQTVVSYGKKFTVSGTSHYNPFDGMSGAKTLAQLGDYIDTATSLGMDNWKAGTSNYYKPFNGGRVVKWAASDGTIKTSVTMMPPNAQIMDGTASNAYSDAEVQAGTNNHTITFNTSAIDHSLSEVAKTFHIREFGNGAANGGESSGTFPDVTMVWGTDSFSYVMDDGLTSFVGYDVQSNSSHFPAIEGTANGDGFYITWIGTGISAIGQENLPNLLSVAQNLPYGSHIMRVEKTSGADSFVSIDGVGDDRGEWPYAELNEITFHQPKKPPVPEDACILADYMLMADFVPQATAGIQYLSKGTRMCSISRDVFANETDGHAWLFAQNQAYEGGFWLYTSGTADSDTSFKLRMPAFATNYSVRGYQMEADAKLFIGDTDKDSASTRNNNTHGSWSYLTNNEVLGVQNWGVNAVSGQVMYISAFEFATPTHTSSHYQSFETPMLRELVGGDRNMEQNNLIVTADGKSWDQLTRDTSYIGKGRVHADFDGSHANGSTFVLWDEWRGRGTNSGSSGSNVHWPLYTKDFAIAYNALVCLVDGQYSIYLQDQNSNDQGAHMQVYINDVLYLKAYSGTGHGMVNTGPFNVHLFRGDYIKIKGNFNSYANICTYEITRI